MCTLTDALVHASFVQDETSLRLQEDSQIPDGYEPAAAGSTSPESDAIWYKDATLSAERMRIRTLTVTQLKDELKACGGQRTGKKSELMARLMDATKAHWSETGLILSTTTTIVRSVRRRAIQLCSHMTRIYSILMS
jgi:hypothetical protein